MKKILDFFKSLFDAKSNTDEKVVVGFMSFAVMVFIALVQLFTGLSVPFEIFATFATITMACFGLGTYTAVRTTSAKADVATEVLKSDAGADSNDTAREILQSDKPPQ